MFYKIIKFISNKHIIFYKKLCSSEILNKIFTKSNFSKIIIIFIIGFISRILVCHFYDVNVYTEYFRKISCIYYILMATFVVIISEVVSYFEINIIPSFILDSYTLVTKGLVYALKLWVNINETISLVNKKIYYIIYTKGVGYNLRDIKVSSCILYIKDILRINIDKVSIDSQVTDLNNNVGCNKSLNSSKGVKITNVVNKNTDNHEILLPKVYKSNGNIVRGNLTEESSNMGNINTNEVISNNNPNKSNLTIAASEVGFPSDTIIRGNDILLVSPNRNVENATNNYSIEVNREGDFNLYDSYPASEDLDFQTPATMSPLFNTYSVNPNAGFTGLVQTSTGMRPVSTTSSYHLRANNYSAPLTVRNKVGNPSTLWNPVIKSGNINILPTDSEPNLSRGSILCITNPPLIYSESSYSRPYDDVIIPRINSSNNPCSPNYVSKHHKSVDYAKVRTNVLANMNEKYTQGNLLSDKEVVVINNKKLGKVKLGFKELGGKFNNGVYKIKSLYIKYEGIGKRKFIWNVFEEGAGNYESYADFKKSWDSKTKLWNEIKSRVKRDIKRDIEDLLGMKVNKGVITSKDGNRLIDDILERKRDYEIRKANHTKVKSSHLYKNNKSKTYISRSYTNINTSQVQKVGNSINSIITESNPTQQLQEEIQNKSFSKHRKHNHSHKHSHSHKHRSECTHNHKKRS